MNILLVGPTTRFGWMASTTRALEHFGHAVTAFPYNGAWVDRTRSPALAAPLAWAPAVRECVVWFQDAWFHRRDQRLVRLVRRLRPDLILILKGETLSAEVLLALKRYARGPLVTWWVDDPWRYPEVVERLPLFDYVFIFDRAYVPELAAQGVRQARFLPCACDETVYRPLSLSAAEQRRFACDVAFVSWYYPERAAVVRTLASELAVGLWGGGWKDSRAQHELASAGLVRGGVVEGVTVAKIYNAARIGLNVHHRQSRLGGLNTRTFELLATGVFELMDQVPGMEELLTPNEEVVVFRSAKEALALARYYLRHPEERRRIATRGRARVLREHTYVKRLETLLRGVSG